jgi:hypothetical protein
MKQIHCAGCGKSHDLSDLEPSFSRPTAYFGLPEDERSERTMNTAGLCAIRGEGTDPDRFFVRVLLPVPIRGESRKFCWGIWAEVDEADFIVVDDNFENPAQAELPPFRGRLANEIPFMPEGAATTLGLQGMIQLTSPQEYPEFVLDEFSAHPFVLEQREGVFAERLLEYLSPTLHAS